LKATIQLHPRALQNLTLAVGGAMGGLSAKDVALSQRSMAAYATCVCLLDADRALVCDSIAATVWDLNVPAVMARLEFRSHTMQGAFPAQITAAGDTVAALRPGELNLWEIPRRAGAPIAQTKLDFSDPAAFRRVPEGTQSPKTVNRQVDLGLHSFRISPNGKWFISHIGKQMSVWDAVTGTKLAETELSERELNECVFSSDASILCTLGVNLRIWRLPNLEPVAAIPQFSRSEHVAASPDGRQSYVFEHGVVGEFPNKAQSAIVSLDPPAELRIGPDTLGDYQIAPSGPVVFRGISQSQTWGDGPAVQIDISSGPSGDFALNPSGTVLIDIDVGLLGATLTTIDLKQAQARQRNTARP